MTNKSKPAMTRQEFFSHVPPLVGATCAGCGGEIGPEGGEPDNAGRLYHITIECQILRQRVEREVPPSDEVDWF